MLRRPPTAITLMAEDVAAYEDKRERQREAAEMQKEAEREAREAAMRAHAQAQVTPDRSQSVNLNGEGRDLRQARLERVVKTREERMGLGQGSRG